MFTEELCHYCEEYKLINLKGQSFLPNNKTIQYRLCHSCCHSLKKFQVETMSQIKVNPEREKFWEIVFANAAAKE